LRSSSQMLSSSLDFTTDNAPDEPSPETSNDVGGESTDGPSGGQRQAEDTAADRDRSGKSSEHPDQSGTER
jgi:hypothetical protein